MIYVARKSNKEYNRSKGEENIDMTNNPNPNSYIQTNQYTGQQYVPAQPGQGGQYGTMPQTAQAPAAPLQQYNWQPHSQPMPGNTAPMIMNPPGPVDPIDLVPETVQSPLYIPGFLAQNIGKLMRVEFLVGNQVADRAGRLTAVGASYILLTPIARKLC